MIYQQNIAFLKSKNNQILLSAKQFKSLQGKNKKKKGFSFCVTTMIMKTIHAEFL